MTNRTIRPMKDGEEEAVIALWTACGLTRPWNDPVRDIAFARSGPASDVLVMEENGVIAASVMVGHDGHRGSVYYVSARPDCQGRGVGRAIMEAAEEWLKARGVWKLNLMIREDNHAVRDFYSAIGYEREERLNMAKRLEDG